MNQAAKGKLKLPNVTLAAMTSVNIYETIRALEYSMRGFLESYEKNGFVQIGKSMVVNLYKVSRVKADLNMRLRLHMDNGEILILNRTYKKSFLDALARIRKI